VRLALCAEPVTEAPPDPDPTADEGETDAEVDEASGDDSRLTEGGARPLLPAGTLPRLLANAGGRVNFIPPLPPDPVDRDEVAEMTEPDAGGSISMASPDPDPAVPDAPTLPTSLVATCRPAEPVALALPAIARYFSSISAVIPTPPMLTVAEGLRGVEAEGAALVCAGSDPLRSGLLPGGPDACPGPALSGGPKRLAPLQEPSKLSFSNGPPNMGLFRPGPSKLGVGAPDAAARACHGDTSPLEADEKDDFAILGNLPRLGRPPAPPPSLGLGRAGALNWEDEA
jgi:hypothetical protein